MCGSGVKGNNGFYTSSMEVIKHYLGGELMISDKDVLVTDGTDSFDKEYVDVLLKNDRSLHVIAFLVTNASSLRCNSFSSPISIPAK